MEHLRQATGAEPVGPCSDEFLCVSEFAKLVARYLERALSQRELDRLAGFFKSLAPLKKSEIESELKKAISVKGSALHLRFYLEHLEKVVQRGRK